MPKKHQSAPRYLYHLFQHHAPSQEPDPPCPEEWWQGNSERYLLVATIMATSIEEALLIAEPKLDGWYHHAGVTLRPVGSPRVCLAGDVLVVDNQCEGRQTWMIVADRWTRLSDPPTEEPTHRDGQQKEILSVAWSPDGDRFAACGGMGLVRVYTPGSRFDPGYDTHAGMARAVAWSPDGARIAVGDGNDATHIFDVAQDTSTALLGSAASGRVLICREGVHPSLYKGAYALAWSPDGLRVAAGNHLGVVRVWNAGTGWCEARLLKHRNAVRALAWSPDGRFLATASADGTALVWYRHAWTIEASIQVEQLGALQALAWSPSGDALLLGGPGGSYLQLHDARSGSLIKDISLARYCWTEGVLSVAYAPNGRYAVAGCADGTIQIVNVDEARHIHTYHGAHAGCVNAVAWSPTGILIASGGEDTRVRVWAAPSAALPPSSPLL